MVNRIGTIYLLGLNKGFSLKVCVGSWVQHETIEESQRIQRPKHCEYSNKDEDNSPNILSDKNYQDSSKKFRQIRPFLLFQPEIIHCRY